MNPPRLGDPIAAGLGYKRRPSADKQAEYWNLALAADPALGPPSGFVVGVSPIRDQNGYYQLVWVARDFDDHATRLENNGAERDGGLLRPPRLVAEGEG